MTQQNVHTLSLNRHNEEKLEEIKATQKEIMEYFESQKIVEFINYRVVLGQRSIGKTHMIISEMYKQTRKLGTAFMVLFRLQDQKRDIHAITAKYGPLLSGSGYRWRAAADVIYKEKYDRESDTVLSKEIIGYYGYLNGADKGKTSNFDEPNVTHIFMDEVYSFRPVSREYEKLKLIIGTVSRTTHTPQVPQTVYLAGNKGMGIAPILQRIIPKIKDQKGKYHVQFSHTATYWINEVKSINPQLNITHRNVGKREIAKDLVPAMVWNYLGESYELYQLTNHLYVRKAGRHSTPLTYPMIIEFRRLVARQADGLTPIIFECSDCTHIVTKLDFQHTIL